MSGLAMMRFIECIVKVDLCGLVGPMISSFDQLIQDQSVDEQSTIVSALTKLAEHSKLALCTLALLNGIYFSAELRESIRVAIPSLIELLKSTNSKLRSTAVSTLVKLCAHGRLPPNIIMTKLTIGIDELWGAFETSIPQIFQLFDTDNSSEIHSTAANLICSVVEQRKPP